MTPRAAIIGIAGPELAAEEVALFGRHRPAGAILFRRNVESPTQVTALCAALRAALGPEAPILIDQEGGRVARLRPPHWPDFPPAALFEHAPAMAAEANATLLGLECASLGLDVVCAPLLDLRLPGMHPVIGDRAFSADPAEVARLGAAWVRGLQQAGCIPVVKHIPGHGRAAVDSHEALPRIAADRATLAADFAPFRALAAQDGGVGFWAMTAHILYEALDPALPATLSPGVVQGVIRGEIGFDGVLVSDDLAMGALAGRPGDLASASLAAGCDLALHCTGVLAETAALLEACPALSADAARRLAAARAAMQAARQTIDPRLLAEIRDRLLATRPAFA
ncbi:beta-N-acetylhexosaminidase [Falsiroseomonas selenitidurans]|uniref:beta-N-acetylhexosaminidase n=1 Tax=Falsiroseomonas selenitidurans TaxID=2716335 RepID=A0ABX1EC83_9PROT|nr:beta-N-acetylhexosaminidase [Falsiroseomonas selenitidurans]NKC34446.1 beta-N-acetylhexosaminidase [Falsiroseomonas selenitidurans]